MGPDEAIPDLLAANLREAPDRVGLRVQRTPGQWSDVTYREFGEQVAGVAKGW